MSQVEMANDILRKAKTPLHVSEIIARIEKLHGQRVERESLVSALVKKVQRQDRFVRTDKNVFGLIEFGR
jgi:DNA-directed RNA polymerase delta subunit